MANKRKPKSRDLKLKIGAFRKQLIEYIKGGKCYGKV
jgi:hypothetical protein